MACRLERGTRAAYWQKYQLPDWKTDSDFQATASRLTPVQREA